ncbi:methyl-CpG-binding domain-containing protein 7-like [Cynara cardunculus var. scolymus]|uniref:MBD domain-containing protein n=1 Tax=Cynara cardunculus var. scolymus TaxID=59895 RepID=A0A103Y6T7_CYNCS|nr:methyl-CpG-binding domain-containing protein 7-like [Cynara cardunculus var. scolymus]KVI03590.1 hypothetical protein Ccrd_018107 [Cynara cardunculus var. scolymus]
MAEPVTDGEDYAFQRQLAIVDVVTPISHSVSNSDSSSITPFSSPFSLPDGWLVHQVPRSDGIRVDKYYIEPATGRKFRSRNEVKRYLNVEEYRATRSGPLRLDYGIKNSRDRKMNTSGANMTLIRKCGTSKFTLPEDWFVEKVPRKSGWTIDKYYHDPETGRKFRSLKGVERFLTEGCTPTRSSAKRLNYHKKHLENCGSRKKIVSGGKMLDFEEDKYNEYQLVNVTPTSFPSTLPFKLPDGWIVEEVPRKTGGHVDRYYYEPGTGQKFRSLIAAQKHLAELEENSPLSVVLEELIENNLPLSKAFKLRSSIKNHGSYDSWKKSISRKERASSFSSPPSKINWVIASSAGQTWNAFVGDELVPDSLMQQWGKRFMLAIDNNKHNPPVSG